MVSYRLLARGGLELYNMGALFCRAFACGKSIPAKIKDKVPPIISHAYLMLVVVIGFVIFNADGIGSAAADLAGMFSGKYPLYSETALYYLRSYLIPLAIGAVGSTPIIKTAGEKLVSGRLGSKAAVILEPVFILILLTAASAYLIDGSYNPFLYFRF